VTKNNNPQVASKVIIQEKTPQEPLIIAIMKTRSRDLGKTFEYNVFPTMDLIEHVITNVLVHSSPSHLVGSFEISTVYKLYYITR
jgi:hypothetical protein